MTVVLSCGLKDKGGVAFDQPGFDGVVTFTFRDFRFSVFQDGAVEGVGGVGPIPSESNFLSPVDLGDDVVCAVGSAFDDAEVGDGDEVGACGVFVEAVVVVFPGPGFVAEAADVCVDSDGGRSDLAVDLEVVEVEA
ncbi:hypothetical protein BG418_01520 [Streptomyces sp. CBMA152]|nr:hypothetical protein [Streptomyces sp. CBMA152]